MTDITPAPTGRKDRPMTKDILHQRTGEWLTDSPTDSITPAPKPVTVSQVLLSLIKSNKSERAVVDSALVRAQEEVQHLTDEVARIDAIAEGLEATLKAVRYPKASAPSLPPQ